MEEGVVEVGFCADRVEGSAVPGADFLDEVRGEVGACLHLVVVVEVDLYHSQLFTPSSRDSMFQHT